MLFAIIKTQEQEREGEGKRERKPAEKENREKKKHMPTTTTSLLRFTNTRKHTVLGALYCACFEYAFAPCRY